MTADLSNLVVEVLHNRGDDNDPDWSVGSGFFVGTRLVLTALHNVDGQGELLIRVHGKEEYPALLRLQGDKDIVDLAVLEVPDVAVDVPPLRYGTVDRSAPAVVEGCRAVGFPGFKERVHNLKPQRFSAQVDGEIPTGENLDQPLLTLQVRRSPRPLPSSVVRESEWAGMSGAMVFSGNIIVGVITEHHLPEGESALTVVPITAIDLLSEATKWWELLGVDRQAFVRLPGEAPTSLSISARPESFIPIPHSPLFQPRPDEFENLERLLFGSKRENPSPRLGLVGMAGVGKTQLAVELAHRCLAQNRFPAGIFWMTALGKDLYDWQPRFAQLARDTGYVPPNDDVSSAENERRRAIHFCRYLADHQDALLILDNIEDPSLVMTALPTLVGREVACSILYTSHITLSPEGATTYPVEPLSQENALRLLLQETREPLLTQIEAKLPNAEAKNARDLCQSVGYLPLALKQLHDLLRRDRHLTLARLLEALAQRGALKLIQPLFPTFQLSWEQVQGEDAQRLFKLACYFPEAAPIPLWLLGLAAGLGEEGDILTQLGEARVELQELSLMEELSGDQVRLHPLVREFGLRLVEGAGDKGKTLLEEAGERLTTECTNLNNLEARALRAGYLGCLEQVRAARQYLEQIAPTQARALTRIEHWLDQESYLLADGAWWPKRLVGLFYQQLFNHSVETGQPLKAAQAPVSWVRQREPAGREYPALVRIFAGHTGGVHGVAFSPDGRQVLTGSADMTVRLWDATSGRELRRFEGHTGMVKSVAFSPDGRQVLTGSADMTVRLWDAAGGQELRRFEGQEWPNGEVSSVAFSPDGRQVLTGSEYGTVQLWDATSGRELVGFEGHIDGVHSVAFSPDGRRVLTGAHDRTVRLWDATSGRELRFKTRYHMGHSYAVTSVAFSPDGRQVLTGSQDHTARLWDATSGRELRHFEGHYGHAVTSVAFSLDGRQVLTGSEDKTARLWEVASGRELRRFAGHRDSVWSVAFSPDGRQVLTGSEDKTARLWEIASGQVGGRTDGVTSVAFSPDGRQVLTSSSDRPDKAARLWEVASGRELARFGGHTDWVLSVAFSPDGRQVLTNSLDKVVRLWEVASGRELRRFAGHRDSVWSVAFSPDGRQVLTGSEDKTARLWDATSGRELRRFEGHTFAVTRVAFSPNGRQILTCSHFGPAQLWDAASGRELARFGGHTDSVWNVAFSPDGRQVLTSSQDKTAQLWDAASGRELARFGGHTDGVSSVAFSPDGRVAFSPDGRQAIICSGNGHIYFWQVIPPDVGSLVGMYVASYRVEAMHWQDARHITLADSGGPYGRPYFYHLTLEGM